MNLFEHNKNVSDTYKSIFSNYDQHKKNLIIIELIRKSLILIYFK